MRIETTALIVAVAAGLAAPLQASSTDAIVLYSAGIDGLLDDPKDAGLQQALVLMEQNGLSLPPDMGKEEKFAIGTAARLLLSEIDFRVAMRPDAPSNSIPFSLTIRSSGNEGATPEELVSRVEKLIQGSKAGPGRPDPDNHGLMLYNENDPDPLMWVGTSKDNGHETAVMSVGSPPESSTIDWSGCGLPSGTDILAGVIVDFQELQLPLARAAVATGPETAAVSHLMGKWGLLGPDAMRLEFAVGRNDDAMQLGGRISNYGKHFGQYVVEGGVRAADLKAVPKDAVAAQVSRFNISGFLDSMMEMGDAMAPPLGQGPDGQPIKASDMACQQFKMMLGIDPRTELIDYLGDTMTIYRSISTGGGGLMSLVMLVEASNPDALATSLGTLAARASAMASPMTQGYVQMSNWTHPDCGEIISLVFPGIPIPMELSLAVKDNWLVTALTPQALVAACQQLDARDSLKDAKGFRKYAGSKAIGAMQVNYNDVPAQLAGGYTLSSAVASAISNYTRPRRKADSGISMVMPTFGQLAKGARPCVLIARMDGVDLEYSGTSDSSMNVLGTGMASHAVILAPLAAGVVFPAITQARDRAQQVKKRTEEQARDRAESFHRQAQETQETHRSGHDEHEGDH